MLYEDLLKVYDRTKTLIVKITNSRKYYASKKAYPHRPGEFYKNKKELLKEMGQFEKTIFIHPEKGDVTFQQLNLLAVWIVENVWTSEQRIELVNRTLEKSSLQNIQKRRES